MARVTATTTPAILCQNPGARDLAARAQRDDLAASFVVFAPGGTGTVLLKHAATDITSALAAGITAAASTFSVPTGQGAQFPAAGTVLIESEQLTFTRTGDTFTVARGASATAAAAHTAGTPVAFTAPDMSDAARWDFSKMALSYVCEPGIALWAQTQTGTIALDVLRGGER